MGKKICGNCEQTIGNLEESFLYKNYVVCKVCKAVLEQNSQSLQSADNHNMSLCYFEMLT